MTDMQTPADVGRAVVALATGKSQGSSFVVSAGESGEGIMQR
jgi:hypothetical protein